MMFFENKTLFLFNRVAISFGGDCMADDVSFYGIAVFISVKQAVFLGLSIDNVWNSKVEHDPRHGDSLWPEY